MNYIKVHNSIISRAIKRQGGIGKSKPLDGYYETHHIVPRCMNGSNENVNLVHLTSREHFLVHWLLVEINRNNKFYFKLVKAWDRMCCVPERLKERNSSSRYFKYAREEAAIARRNPNFDKVIVIYDEVEREIRYEGTLRTSDLNPRNYSQVYNSCVTNNTCKQGKYQYCTFFISDYYYSNEEEIKSTIRKPKDISSKNRRSKYRNTKVKLVKNGFNCIFDISDLGSNYTLHYNRAKNNYVYTKQLKKGATLMLV